MVLMLGCGSEEPATSEAGWRLPLAVVWPAAERLWETPEVGVYPLEDRRFLVSGFATPPNATAADARKRPPLWIEGTRGELRLCLRERAARELQLSVYSLVPGQSLRLEWNGREVGSCPLRPGWQDWSVELESGVQREGRNDLVLLVEGGAEPRPRRSFALNRLAVEILEDAPRKRLRDARAAILEGSQTVAWSGAGPPDTIEQVSGSQLAFHQQIPESATLKVGCAVSSVNESGRNDARLRIRATDRSGESRVLLERVVTEDEPGDELAVSLDAFAGDLVRLDLEVESVDGDARVVIGSWIHPRIEAPAAPPFEQRIDATPDQRDTVGAWRETTRHAPVVVFLLDTLRADHVGRVLAGESVTPCLDALAAAGHVFESTYSHANYTLASIGAYLTSRPTWEHNVWERLTVNPDLVTWPEQFAREGYRTVGITHTPNGAANTSFDRGFETFVEVFRDPEDPATRRKALGEMSLPHIEAALAVEDPRPVFLWIHLVEPHAPYLPPDPWSEKYDPDYEGELHGTSATVRALEKGTRVATLREQEHVTREYAANLNYVDDVVWRIRGLLEQAGVWNDAVVTVVSDHGEAFFEREDRGIVVANHGSTLHDEQVRVPWILRMPKKLALTPGRVRTPVSAMDVLPTVADLVGVAPIPGSGFSQAHRLQGDGAEAGDPVLFHSWTRAANFFYPGVGLRLGRYKLLHLPGEYTLLYDVDSDPQEQVDLTDTDPILAGYLRQRVCLATGFGPGGFLEFADGVDVTEVDAETLEQLRELGYVR